MIKLKVSTLTLQLNFIFSIENKLLIFLPRLKRLGESFLYPHRVERSGMFKSRVLCIISSSVSNYVLMSASPFAELVVYLGYLSECSFISMYSRLGIPLLSLIICKSNFLLFFQTLLKNIFSKVASSCPFCFSLFYIL